MVTNDSSSISSSKKLKVWQPIDNQLIIQAAKNNNIKEI